MHLKPRCGPAVCAKVRIGFMIWVKQVIPSAMALVKIDICELGARKLTTPVGGQTELLETFGLSDLENMYLKFRYIVLLGLHRKVKNTYFTPHNDIINLSAQSGNILKSVVAATEGTLLCADGCVRTTHTGYSILYTSHSQFRATIQYEPYHLTDFWSSSILKFAIFVNCSASWSEMRV